MAAVRSEGLLCSGSQRYLPLDRLRGLGDVAGGDRGHGRGPASLRGHAPAPAPRLERVISRHTHAEASYVTSGCAAGLQLGAAAILSGDDRVLMEALPHTDGLMKREFVARRFSRQRAADGREYTHWGYAHAVRGAGASSSRWGPGGGLARRVRKRPGPPHGRRLLGQRRGHPRAAAGGRPAPGARPRGAGAGGRLQHPPPCRSTCTPSSTWGPTWWPSPGARGCGGPRARASSPGGPT